MPRPTGPAHPLHLEHQRGGGWRARAGAVHLTLRPSTGLALLLFGWFVDGSGARALLWVVAGTAALLVHELGHAWVGRLGGASPYVEISWHGGTTRWQPDDVLSRRAEAMALLAGPVLGGALGWAALAASPSTLGLGSAGPLLGELLALFGTVSLAVAALDLLPVFPRDGARLLLLVMPGTSVRAVVRTATIGAVVAACATVAVLVTPARAVALLTGGLTLSNTWLALRGDRAIGRPVPEAIDRGDWASVRRRISAGCDSPELAALAQERALATSDFHGAADIGDAALARGWHTIGFARRTARARAFLEQDDLAMHRVRDAVRFGADPDELARDGVLRPLSTRTDWPDAPDRGDRPGDFVIDLRDQVSDRA